LPAAGQETPDPGGTPDGPQPSDVAPPALSYDPYSDYSNYSDYSSSDAGSSRTQVVVVAPEPDPVDTTPPVVPPLPVPAGPVAGLGAPGARSPEARLGEEPVANRTPVTEDSAAAATASETNLLLPGLLVLATVLLMIGGFWPRKESVSRSST
jgi:hypothetical protein